jgi:hypothetical protein
MGHVFSAAVEQFVWKVDQGPTEKTSVTNKTIQKSTFEKESEQMMKPSETSTCVTIALFRLPVNSRWCCLTGAGK